VKTFIILWLGQLFSSVGSAMTYFTLTLWVWQKTESATAIALILVFYQLPQVIITPLTGILIDRTSRKQLLIISDTGSAFCTISVGILAFLGTLQVWHIYLIARVFGADYLIGIIVTTCSSLTAGVLSDRIFEPLMKSQFSLTSGSGMALLIGISAMMIILVSSKATNFLD